MASRYMSLYARRKVVIHVAKLHEDCVKVRNVPNCMKARNSSRSDGIVEAVCTLERSNEPLSAEPVAAHHNKGSDTHDDEGANLEANGGIDTSSIRWVIFLHEDGGGNNATNTSRSNNDGSLDGALTVRCDVICRLDSESEKTQRGVNMYSHMQAHQERIQRHQRL